MAVETGIILVKIFDRLAPKCRITDTYIMNAREEAKTAKKSIVAQTLGSKGIDKNCLKSKIKNKGRKYKPPRRF